MKKILLILTIFFLTATVSTKTNAQCSICTKTVQQMGNKAAQGFNSGIIYLMLIPYAAIGFVGYKWWKSDHERE
ncbi:MAG: hypothetical protein ABIR03_14755 [Ginsengibacter sp.]